MNEIRVFESKEFGSVRTVMVDGEPWFVGADVARALGYADPSGAIHKHCRWVSKRTIPHPQSPGKAIEVNVIPEGDLYRLILRSQLPTAEKFECWVCDDVLPAVRKTGTYSINSRCDSYMIEDPVERAKRWIEEAEERRALEEKVSELAPKAKLCDDLLDARLLVNFRDAAKEIGISQTQFTGWLKDNGYVYSNSAGELRPMEPYMASGLFQVKPYQNPYNGYRGSRTYITGRGLAAFKTLIENSGHSRHTMVKHGGKKVRGTLE